MESSQNNKAIIIATEGLTTRLLYNALSAHWDITQVIIEEKISSKDVVKGRIKKVGVFKTFGQIAFIKLIQPFLRSKKRIEQIINEHGLSQKDIPLNVIHHIKSVNDGSIISQVKSLNPDVIFVNGTRIISKEILENITPPFINIHVGITPKYRGVHGGYWALYNNDESLFGVTVHLIDAGIDTGDVLDQETIEIDKNDNFNTYPILQFAEGIERLIALKENIQKGNILRKEVITTESHLYYHPRFFQYLFARLFKGVK